MLVSCALVFVAAIFHTASLCPCVLSLSGCCHPQSCLTTAKCWGSLACEQPRPLPRVHALQLSHSSFRQLSGRCRTHRALKGRIVHLAPGSVKCSYVVHPRLSCGQTQPWNQDCSSRANRMMVVSSMLAVYGCVGVYCRHSLPCR